jgi:hypothetical protein
MAINYIKFCEDCHGDEFNKNVTKEKIENTNRQLNMICETVNRE